MTDHAAVRAGDEGATMDVLSRLARQAVGRNNYPPPVGHVAWTEDALLDLVSNTYARKGQFVEKAMVATATARDLELYLLTTFKNVLRDQARGTERGKLIERLKTILNPLPQFVRVTQPYNAWRLDTAPDISWQGDIGYLFRTASALRGIAVTAWNTAGKTPKATADAIVRVCEAALNEADGFVRDPDLAEVVQVCVPAAPLEPEDLERSTDADDDAASEIATRFSAESPEPDELRAKDVAGAIWDSLTHDERRAIPYLSSARGIATELGLGRRTADPIAASAKTKIETATASEIQDEVVGALMDRSEAFAAELEGDTL